MIANTIVDLKKEKEKAKQYLQEMGTRVLICAGTGCVANGSLEVYKRFQELGANVELKEEKYTPIKTGCHGFCENGVLVMIPEKHVTYAKVKPEDVDEIVSKHLIGCEIVERLLYRDPATNKSIKNNDEINFYAKQKRTSLSNCGHINPEDINECIASSGYQALEKILNGYTSEQVCNEMIESGLRGRGGGGFPTGRKWGFVRIAEGDKKYVICNGDEGDPGAFMDRSLMEGDPHRILEGMAIAAYAVGADEGYIYVRAEYPLAVDRLKKAIVQAEQYGLLGKNILGKDFSFIVHIKEGAGAFVCGEETALIASIEGERGMPRPKPPFPANKGLFEKPTLINNVETFANVPLIINNGAQWFKDLGTANNAGTKTFALTGEVRNTGLIEVPMGSTLRQIIFDIGGGIRNDKKFKAVQIGGPSGGCLTEEHLDMPLDYDSLTRAGAMIGSGGLVVLNEDTCIVEIARFFMNFTQNESCGKCVPCREGTKNMLKILEKIVGGKATMEDLEILQELALAVKDGSLCGLGKTAPNPVLSTLQYFKDEYLAHIVEKRCPAGVCQAFKKIEIIKDLCKGCSKCARQCPVNAIEGKVKEPFIIDQNKCIKCGACIDACPFKAIKEV
ncbi:MAG: NADH dehydrogenase [Candidatus Melainabacteria bacterium RIFOXYA12_FULL_32_12]|nr:MAG: NADH dehydrogenase [Candidatus Melainabacteria bacterium RIFOXYA2_FULL_32_9]OGI24276.1 MAG: NADH dehydrogenase [Candidatus Melainabacteria bacterium RIFOXYA12_FULL_32_12]